MRLDQVAAQEARVDRGERGGEHAPRHDQRLALAEDVVGVLVGAAARAAAGSAPMSVVEQVQRDEAEEVDRRGDRDQRDAHRHAVEQRAGLDRRR